MICDGYLTVNKRGSCRFSKNRVGLNWDEISIKVSLEVPDELFNRPLIRASLIVDRTLIPKEQDMSLVLNSKDLIEQSTGAKVEFSIVKNEED